MNLNPQNYGIAFHSPIKFYIKDMVIYRSIGVKTNLNKPSVDRMVVWFTKVPWNVLSGELGKQRYFPHCWSDEGTCTLNSKAASSYAKNQWEFWQLVLLKTVTKNMVGWNLFRVCLRHLKVVPALNIGTKYHVRPAAFQCVKVVNRVTVLLTWMFNTHFIK